MKILIAPNAFKGSLNADEAAACIERGLRRAGLTGELLRMPIADGGDGTLKAFLANGGEISRATVLDPLGREITAEYATLPDGNTAVVEMARASGYALLAADERDPMRATSYGTGQLLAAAAASGRKKIILGVGGSATVDGGAGALQALGMGVYDAAGARLPVLAGGRLREIERLDTSEILPLWRAITLIIASDVENPVFGEKGAAAVFGPQKGASPVQVRELELGLGYYFSLLEKATENSVSERAGSGAAGALAGGLMAALGGRIEQGVELLLQHNGFAARLEDANMVITGEGYMDEQTLGGKAPMGVARLARAADVPTVALVGGSDLSEARAQAAGFRLVLPIVPHSMPLNEALAGAPAFLEAGAQRLGEMLKSGEL